MGLLLSGKKIYGNKNGRMKLKHGEEGLIPH
jgi:hypothetical protein